MEPFHTSDSSAFSKAQSTELTPSNAKLPVMNVPMSLPSSTNLHPSWLQHLPNGFNTSQLPQYYPPVHQPFMPVGLNIPGYPLPSSVYPQSHPNVQPLNIGTFPNPQPPIPPASQLKMVESKPQQLKNKRDSPEVNAELRGKHPFTLDQKTLLMERFRQGGKVGMREAVSLAERTGLSPKQVRTWFANRKAKEKAELNKMKSHRVQPETHMHYHGMPHHGFPVERHY